MLVKQVKTGAVRERKTGGLSPRKSRSQLQRGSEWWQMFKVFAFVIVNESQEDFSIRVHWSYIWEIMLPESCKNPLTKFQLQCNIETMRRKFVKANAHVFFHEKRSLKLATSAKINLLDISLWLGQFFFLVLPPKDSQERPVWDGTLTSYIQDFFSVRF